MPTLGLVPFCFDWEKDCLQHGNCAAIMTTDIRAEDSKYILAPFSCLYLLPPPHQRSSAEIRASCYKHRLILHRGSMLNGSGQDKTGSTLLDRAERVELVFSQWTSLDTAPTEEQGRAASVPHQSSPAPQPKPSPPATTPLLVGKGGSGCLLWGFCCPCQASAFTSCFFCPCIKPLKGRGEFPHGLVNSLLSRTGAIKTLKML